MGGSRTAVGAAAQRAVLTDLGAADDPLARSMLPRPLAGLTWVLGHLPRRAFVRSVTLAGAAGSVRWFDAQVERALADVIDQLVIVGAGYDTRAQRLDAEEVRVVEVDHPATQAAKRRRTPTGGAAQTYVPVDLAADDVVFAPTDVGPLDTTLLPSRGEVAGERVEGFVVVVVGVEGAKRPCGSGRGIAHRSSLVRSRPCGQPRIHRALGA